jgi:putative ABC transport system permease protein
MEGIAHGHRRCAAAWALSRRVADATTMLIFALRNIARHKLRTAITLAAIAFGVTGLIVSAGFVRDILFQLAEATIHSQSGHLQVHRKGYYEHGARSPEKYLIDSPEGLRQVLGHAPGVIDTLARLNFSGLLGNGRSDLSVVGEGVEPGKEARLGSYVKIIAGRQLEDQDAYGMLVGEGVASSLSLRPGDRATVLLNTAEGAMNSLDFEITGVFQTFSKEFDAHAVRIALPAAQELLTTKGVNSLVVSLRRTDDTDLAAAQLAAQLDGDKYEVRTWRELNDFYQKAVDLYDRQFGVLRLIVLVMVLLLVANTVNMTVFERVGEFGTMMAIGNRSSAIFRLVVLENALVGLIGALLGLVAGVLAAWGITALGIPMPPLPNANTGYAMSIRVSPVAVMTAVAVGMGATVLAALVPAARVSRKPIVESLRENY